MKHLIKINDASEIEQLSYDFIVALDDNNNVFIKLPFPNNEIHYTATNRVEPRSSALPTIISNDFDSNTKKGIIKFTTDVISIGNYAFENRFSLTSIEIPNSVISIGSSAFYGCSSLTSIIIPDSVTSIGFDTFSYCSGLTFVTIGNSVTRIEDYAFSGCSNLTSITIGNSVENIGWASFSGCSGLMSVTCKAITPPTILFNTFNNVTKSIPVYVPAGSVSTYQSASYWNQFTNILPIQ